jgi:putative transposase
MSDYRRAYVPGGCYFFTVVIHGRCPVFSTPEGVKLLRAALRSEMTRRPFQIDGFVVLPDHLHAIWRLPSGDSDFSSRWREIKKAVTKGLGGSFAGTVWQRRFWEHALRDEEDWRRHMDYIHFNPVKHRLVRRPRDWGYSSFATCVAKGWYNENWGEGEVNRQVLAMDRE